MPVWFGDLEELMKGGEDAIDDVARTDVALFQRLQRSVQKSCVGRAVAARESDNVCHRWIGFDHADQLLHRIVHHGEGGILRSLQAANDCAGVLLREETLGDANDQQDVHADQISFDNIMLQPEPESCRCPRCIAAFHDFLRKRYPDAASVRRRFGLPDVDWIVPNEWDNATQPDGLAVLNDPVLQEWTRQTFPAAPADHP